VNQVTLKEAQNTLSSLVQKVIGGEEVLIIQNRKPVARLVSAYIQRSTGKEVVKAGSAKGLVRIADDFDEPLEDFEDYVQ
jgi:antitoxin (DNA-binding transcriptional repressor) of toxin-antitoxin stability system